MDPLVEQLKKAAEHQIKQRDIANALRLHDAGIIRSKSSAFWKQTEDCASGLCDELRQAFPNDNRYHVSFVAQPGGFLLNSSKLPRCILSCELDVTGQQILLSERILQAREDPPKPKTKPPITIRVGSEEELLFSFEGKTADTPQDLARAIMGYVLRFSGLAITCSIGVSQ